jgi:8-oxo-dGTP diphosphatase
MRMREGVGRAERSITAARSVTVMAYVEPEIWYQRLATFYAAAGALLRDEYDRILLVKPNYRDEWTLPGGVVEADETPERACEREVLEELDLKTTVSRLLVIDWAPPFGKRPRPFIYFLFGCSPVNGQRITHQTTELDDYGFFTVDEAARRVAPHVSARIPAAVHATTAGITIYLPLNADRH